METHGRNFCRLLAAPVCGGGLFLRLQQVGIQLCQRLPLGGAGAAAVPQREAAARFSAEMVIRQPLVTQVIHAAAQLGVEEQGQGSFRCQSIQLDVDGRRLFAQVRGDEWQANLVQQIAHALKEVI